jgi:hypothetical protein
VLTWSLKQLHFAKYTHTVYLFLQLADSRSTAVILVSVYYVMHFIPTPKLTLKHTSDPILLLLMIPLLQKSSIVASTPAGNMRELHLVAHAEAKC